MRSLLVIISLFLLISCNQSLFVSRKYRGGGNSFEFYEDKSFEYMIKMEGGYVYKYASGSWKQQANQLFLRYEPVDVTQLEATFSSYNSLDSTVDLMINVVPETNNISYNSPLLDLAELEIIINKESHKIRDLNTSINIQSNQGIQDAYFKAYPKPSAENIVEILIDTLYSDTFNISTNLGKDFSFEIDFDPVYFGRVDTEDEVIKVINNNKIKWGQIYLVR